MTMHFIGIAGGIRRYSDASAVAYLQDPLFTHVHLFMTIAAFVTGAAQLIFLFNFFWSLKFGPKAPKNPWDATPLEWITDSPPVLDNFGGDFPSVYRGPYEFSVPGVKEDFVPQHLAPALVAREK
jgi:cytochrome c oxidase subunit 1